MRASMVIKWLHRVTTATLLLLVAGFLLYQYMMNGPKDDTLFSKKQLSENVTLYVTKYNGGGATVSDVYRYYLADDKQTIEQLNHSEPFLVSDTGGAHVSGYGNTVNVKLTGRVYSFSNSTLFYAGESAVIPVINLNAIGVR
ncbi:hypothetical protein AAEY27_18870 [Kosakonia sp. BYX6]|uniref:Uncharacterized protein n=1 Tax=Kosakonia calanthes TaxID=3139408 RepID=A0ABZ3B3A8_9ENTR